MRATASASVSGSGAARWAGGRKRINSIEPCRQTHANPLQESGVRGHAAVPCVHDDAAGLHGDHAVRVVHEEFEVALYRDDREALLPTLGAEQRVELLCPAGIQRPSALVEKDERRLQREGGGGHEPLFLAAGERGCPPPLQAGEPRGGEGLHHARRDGVGGKAPLDEGEAYLFLHREADDLGVGIVENRGTKEPSAA